MTHYFSEKQDSELRARTITVRLKRISFKLHSGAGIFSKGKLDKGTALLINYCEINQQQRMLDIGCGYGVVGIAMKLMHSDSEVVMSDVNERAIMLAKRNVKLNDVDIKVVKSNLYEKLDKFDVILSNPPQSVGKKVCFSIIEEAFSHLNLGGSLQLVARHNKGGKQLMEHMQDVFGNVSVTKRGSGYRVYKAQRK